jgi:ElaB/YqjD/DUF883 family membrane-anchored ribosome-binding protein
MSTSGGAAGQTGASSMGGGEPGLRDEIESLKADLSQLQNDLRTLSRDLVDAARSGVNVARDRMGGAMGSAQDRMSENMKSVQERIEAKPLQSVGIALGVGFIIGALFRRS